MPMWNRKYREFVLQVFGALAAVALAATAHAAGAPLAEVDGATITADEVEGPLAGQLARLQEQIYNVKRQKLDALIAERLLAKEAARRGISVQALLDAEVTSKVALVTEQEVEAVYQANKGKLRGEEAAARQQVRMQLQNQKLAAAREAFVQGLRAQARVVVHLKAPEAPRAGIAVDEALVKGAASAPVTIVEFTDYHCPFCKRAQATLTGLQSRYGDRIRLAHKDFPIDQLHPSARRAHEAARCAHDQGKFWLYRTLLFNNAPAASPDNLNAYARLIGLDAVAFEQCLASGKYQAAVQADVEEGTRAGVTGTPAFFVNGRMISGAQPLERFVSVIDDELTRAR